MSNQRDDFDLYSRMQSGKPLAVYKKKILGKLNVRVLNPFDQKPMHTILQGDPRKKNCPKCFVELWTDKELMYFLRSNRIHLDGGNLIEYTKTLSSKIERTVNNLSDEEIESLVKAPFLKLKKTVEKMTSIAAVSRVVDTAETAGRPEKTMLYLRERLSLMQSGEIDVS